VSAKNIPKQDKENILPQPEVTQMRKVKFSGKEEPQWQSVLNMDLPSPPKSILKPYDKTKILVQEKISNFKTRFGATLAENRRISKLQLRIVAITHMSDL